MKERIVMFMGKAVFESEKIAYLKEHENELVDEDDIEEGGEE